MKSQKIFWLAMLAVLLVTGASVIRLSRRRARLLAMLESQFVPAVVSGQPPTQTIHRAEEREWEKQRHRLKKVQNTVLQLGDEKGTWMSRLAYYEKLYYPPEEPSLKEFRETQPEEYEKLKCKVAEVLRYASAKKCLREEYLARLDLSVLTNDEQQVLISTMEKIAKAEDFLLESGEGELKLYRMAGGRSFSDRQQWLREAAIAHLAAMADWKNAGGTNHYVAVMRALFLHFSSPMNVQPQKPQEIRGSSSVLIPDPEAPNGKRVVSVNVEPGWSPE